MSYFDLNDEELVSILKSVPRSRTEEQVADIEHERSAARLLPTERYQAHGTHTESHYGSH